MHFSRSRKMVQLVCCSVLDYVSLLFIFFLFCGNQARKMQERGWKPQWFVKDKGSDTYRYIGGYWEAREQGKWESCPDIFGQISSYQMLEWVTRSRVLCGWQCSILLLEILENSRWWSLARAANISITCLYITSRKQLSCHWYSLRFLLMRILRFSSPSPLGFAVSVRYFDRRPFFIFTIFAILPGVS